MVPKKHQKKKQILKKASDGAVGRAVWYWAASFLLLALSLAWEQVLVTCSPLAANLEAHSGITNTPTWAFGHGAVQVLLNLFLRVGLIGLAGLFVTLFIQNYQKQAKKS
jgi:hypothetical protein